MEDKYFNEFFYKLYNGKLNIYEGYQKNNKVIEILITNVLNNSGYNFKFKKKNRESLITLISNYLDDPKICPSYGMGSINSWVYPENIGNTNEVFEKWCGDNAKDCERIKELTKEYCENKITTKKIELKDVLYKIKQETPIKRLTRYEKDSLDFLICGLEKTQSNLLSWAKGDNLINSKKEYDKWCETNKQLCEKLETQFFERCINIKNKETKLLDIIEKFLSGKTEYLSQRDKQSIIKLMYYSKYPICDFTEEPYVSDKSKIAPFVKNEEEIKKSLEEFEKWCGGNTNNCEKIKNEVNKFCQKNIYEKSFVGDYFIIEKPSNESIIHDLNLNEISITNRINEYTDKNKEYSEESEYKFIYEELVVPVYENIVNYLNIQGNEVLSYDLKSIEDLNDSNGNTIIEKGSFIEVKDISKLDSYYSEYIASPVKKSHLLKNDTGKKIYGKFISLLLEKIKKESSNTFDKIIDDVYYKISGMVIGGNIYVPKGCITLYISSKGQGYGRFTLRYNINPNCKEDFYKIIKSEDIVSESIEIRKLDPFEKSKLKPMDYVNPIYIQGNVNESYDSYLEQLVENFFNTGKLFP